MSIDGAIVHAMFHTLPDSRTVVTPDAVVSFRETPVGVPVAVKSLFYGGEHRGYEFVYPKGGPIMEARPQPAITYAPVPAAPAEVEKPEIELFVEPLEYQPAQPAADAPVPAEELPKTASPVPLMAVGGRGVISVLSNETPGEMVKMVEAALAGDFDRARRVHERLYPLMQVNFVEVNPGPVKAAMAAMGLLNEVYRLPMCSPRPEAKARIISVLTDLGLVNPARAALA